MLVLALRRFQRWIRFEFFFFTFARPVGLRFACLGNEILQVLKKNLYYSHCDNTSHSYCYSANSTTLELDNAQVKISLHTQRNFWEKTTGN